MTRPRRDRVRLSKAVSRALRHAPEDYGLTLDEEGWVAVDELLGALRARREEWQDLDAGDLAGVLERSEKQRFELRDGRIRAYYGHSLPTPLRRVAAEPPPRLYHGTAPGVVEAILREGLDPRRRQTVHLSTERATAVRVGRRKAPDPVVLVVRAREAWEAGVPFYHGNQDTWLADRVPPGYLERAGEEESE